MDEPVVPQRATTADAVVPSVDWLFEPAWRGDRLVARLAGGTISLSDAAGVPAGDAFGEVVEVLSGAILADAAVIDGVWTAMPFIGDGSPARAWADTIASEGLADELPDPLETERRRAFVAVDLVELDGEPLYEVPLQERRRLLESVIQEGVQVRLSPIVKQPISGWLVGWRENGFTHYLAKHMNSRYAPGTVCSDWLEISVHSSAPRGFMTRMLGSGMTNPRSRRVPDRR